MVSQTKSNKSQRFLYKKITDALRKDITSGKIAVGDRLPRMMDLAKTWKTSYFTIQQALAPLVREGVIEPRGKLGTILVQPRPALTCVGIYYGANIWSIPEAAFYRSLHAELEAQLSPLGISTSLLIEKRSKENQAYPEESLTQAIQERHIQGLIIPIADQPELNWLQELKISKSYMGSGDVPWRVRSHTKKLLTQALEHLKAQGVRGVSILSGSTMHSNIHHPSTMIYKEFVDLVADLGMYTRNTWNHVPQNELRPNELEAYGYEIFSSLWSQSKRPEGIISLSDVIGKGIQAAILQKDISLPQQLKLVQVINKKTGFFTPLQMSFYELDETEIAKALVRQLKRQVNGQPSHEILVAGTLRSPHVPR